MELIFLLTIKDGRLVIIGALRAALLPQLLVSAAAGDVGLDEEAVALAHVQVGQLEHAARKGFRFLQREKHVLFFYLRLANAVRPFVCLSVCPSPTLPVDLFLR